MTMQPWRLLHVDDDPDSRANLKEFLENEEALIEGRRLEVCSESSFDACVKQLSETRFDFVVLDIRDASLPAPTRSEEEAGARVFEAIKTVQFVPVVFYSGFPRKVSAIDKRHHLVRSVDKSVGGPGVLDELTQLAELGIHKVDEAIEGLLRELHRAYMWDFVSPTLAQDDKLPPFEIAYLLSRRYASALSTESPKDLARVMGHKGQMPDPRKHPLMFYIMPAIEGKDPRPADIYRRPKDDSYEYRVLLTPSCDLAQNKASHAVLAACLPLEDMTEVTTMRSQTDERLRKSAEAKVNNWLRNQISRYHFLPAAGALPHLLADFERVEAIPLMGFSNGSGWSRVASLDTPFKEELINRFSHHFGRIGTDDLDFREIFKSLKDKTPFAGE